MKPKADIVCIYCKQLRPPSNAHVMARTLGGDLTAPTNCGGYNGDMGKLDQALAERASRNPVADDGEGRVVEFVDVELE